MEIRTVNNKLVRSPRGRHYFHIRCLSKVVMEDDCVDFLFDVQVCFSRSSPVTIGYYGNEI